MEKRLAAYQDVSLDVIIGGQLLEEAAAARGRDAKLLRVAARDVLDERRDLTDRIRLIMGDDIDALAAAYPDLDRATKYDRELEAWVEPERARFSAWYELFPRSTADEPGRHGTFADVERRLDYVERLGFDTLYLPPIHPIGREKRKGRNNRETAEPGEPGSPWAIGSAEGGHTAVHPELGTLEDFRSLVERRGPRHRGRAGHRVPGGAGPPVGDGAPDWFRQRPDGTIQYAENPPKKYQDIYPFDFETEDWRSLWDELAAVFEYWIAQGVLTFRVDNPHTKPFGFWEWCINRIRRSIRTWCSCGSVHDAAAHGAPGQARLHAVVHLLRVARYQAGAHGVHARTHATEVAEYFRPNFWPNTPDILTEYLQTGGRAAFMNRIVLAAMLTASYGIYGPRTN
jgi:starch synthase (maltosyl-transferring)